MKFLLPHSVVFSLLGLFCRTVQADPDSGTGSVVGFDVETLSTKLPTALSDFTVVLDEEDARAYLAGGCDSPDGNRFVKDFGEFVCDSISSSMFIFDLKSLSFEDTTLSLPVARYRHAAVLVNKQVWLVGGRDVDDNLISTVDVYDIASGNWTTYNLDEEYVTSDLGAFKGPENELAFFVGGYNLTYAPMNTVFAINTIVTTASGVLTVTSKASLQEGRGDLAAVSVLTEGVAPYALVTGGFTDENGYCEPLNVTEYYDFDSDLWREADDLNVARSDKALVVLENIIYSIGGERQIENICLIDEPEPGEETVPVKDVEYWNATSDEWVEIEELPSHRFRFAAVGYDNKVYSFGGQLAFEEECQCFRTSDEVTVYTEEFASESAGSSASATNRASPHMFGSLTIALTLVMAAWV